MKFYARRKGFDTALAVRSAIKQITYSKKKISIEWFYNRSSVDSSPRDPSTRPPAADAAVHSAPNKEEPNRLTQFGPLTPTSEFVPLKAPESVKLSQTITLSFPNTEHNYWDYYKQK